MPITMFRKNHWFLIIALILSPLSIFTQNDLSFSAPNVVTASRTILKGEAVSIERFALDQNILTREIGKLVFYSSLADANNNQNPLTNLLVAPTETTTFYAKKTTEVCKDVKPLTINVALE